MLDIAITWVFICGVIAAMVDIWDFFEEDTLGTRIFKMVLFSPFWPAKLILLALRRE